MHHNFIPNKDESILLGISSAIQNESGLVDVIQTEVKTESFTSVQADDTIECEIYALFFIISKYFSGTVNS